MDCDAEKPPSLPPNTSGSVAPAGPVITAGSKKVRDAVPPGCPFRSNWPLFAGSVRDTTLAAPTNTNRDPVPLNVAAVAPAEGVKPEPAGSLTPFQLPTQLAIGRLFAPKVRFAGTTNVMLTGALA